MKIEFLKQIFDNKGISVEVIKQLSDEELSLLGEFAYYLSDFVFNGKYKPGMKVNFDPNEIALGIEQETEHSGIPFIKKKTTYDHLIEDDKYYSKHKQFFKE